MYPMLRKNIPIFFAQSFDYAASFAESTTGLPDVVHICVPKIPILVNFGKFW
jgi:hypothetical protein